jgi:hypothetical protein
MDQYVVQMMKSGFNDGICLLLQYLFKTNLDIFLFLFVSVMNLDMKFFEKHLERFFLTSNDDY